MYASLAKGFTTAQLQVFAGIALCMQVNHLPAKTIPVVERYNISLSRAPPCC